MFIKLILMFNQLKIIFLHFLIFFKIYSRSAQFFPLFDFKFFHVFLFDLITDK